MIEYMVVTKSGGNTTESINLALNNAARNGWIVCGELVVTYKAGIGTTTYSVLMQRTVSE